MCTRWIVLLAVAGCGSKPDAIDPPASLASPASPVPTSIAKTPGPTRRWVPGDLHMHVAPIDAVEGQTLTVRDLATFGHASGLEFVIATPHVHATTWSAPAKRRAWLARWSQMAAAARAVDDFTVIPGAEYTKWGYGHFGVSGVDLGTLGDDFLASATASGGLVIVNHPFAEPTNIPGIPISHMDLSFRAWTRGGSSPELDGVEVWNVPLALGNLVSPSVGSSGEARALLAADQLARTKRQRVTIVGGSDSHLRGMMPTTWVLAADAREPAILAGLRAGATCVGGPEAGTLEARGDGDPPDQWVWIGDTVRAATTVTLRWSGHGRLFVDGVDAGEHLGAFTHPAAAGVHTYRLQQGVSRSGFIYANL